MPRVNDLSCSLVALEQDTTVIVVVEMSQSSWLVGGVVPGLERRPLKKLEPDAAGLLALIERWRGDAERAGARIERVALAYEAGRDGFWLARWLLARGIEAFVMHATSVAVSREHRRAKTDRLDAALLQRAFLGWLRGEARHCQMVAIPTVEEEDARRPGREREALTEEKTRIVNRLKGALARLGIRGFKPELRKAHEKLADLVTPEGAPLAPNIAAELGRDMERLRLVKTQIKAIEAARAQWLKTAPRQGAAGMIDLLAQVYGLGLETAATLVHEAFSRDLRDRRAVARYGGLTGSPDESGSRRRAKGLSKSGNARVRRVMIQLAWRFLGFQKASALAQWWRRQVEGGRKPTVMIVALARKLLIALWRMVTQGVVPEGLVLHPQS
jgi:transposase